MSKLFERLCQARHLTPDFLKPKYEQLSDPFILYDMHEAVKRIKKAIKSDEKITIYGDYDVDGITASTVMEQTLKLAGVSPDNITIMLPDRFADGYGMSPRLVTRAKEQETDLVITVDCGSRNHEIIDELNKLHIDTIVTDHHETADDLPQATAVINPHRKDHPTPELQNLAGVGVAFKVAQALVEEGLIKGGKEKWLLDLVLLGTICDSMTLTGENRILGYYGLIVLDKTPRPGLKELIRRSQMDKINSENIGFRIGPRLNAAGRLETADISLGLLRADSPVEAAPIAEQLEQLNSRRKTEQIAALHEIESRGISEDPVIVEVGKWHEGILGIVAGQLVEARHRPAFVLAEASDGYLKGSGRSFGDFNLAEALSAVKDTIVGGGGHAAAAGVRLAKDQLSNFRSALNAYYQSLKLTNQEQYFRSHADLEVPDFSDLTLEFLDELSTLEPFGSENEEPIFSLKDVNIVNVARMGADGQHLRLDIKDKSGKALKCIAFRAPEDWLRLNPEYDHIEPTVRLIENNFNGIKSLEAMLMDIRRIEE